MGSELRLSSIEVARVSSDADVACARGIRRTVFVEEQGVPIDVEVDGLDPVCDHFLARVDGVPAATARARATSGGWKIERVAVLGSHRGRGVGARLVRRVLEDAPSAARVYVHAQESAARFWQRLGFEPTGPAFVEGGITHRVMQLLR